MPLTHPHNVAAEPPPLGLAILYAQPEPAGSRKPPRAYSQHISAPNAQVWTAHASNGIETLPAQIGGTARAWSLRAGHALCQLFLPAEDRADPDQPSAVARQMRAARWHHRLLA